MKDLVDYIEAFYNKDSSLKPEEITQINEILENLFLEYICKPFRIIEKSDEYKFAQELRAIRKLLENSPSSLKGLKIKSAIFKNRIDEITPFLEKENLNEFEKKYLYREFIRKYRPYEKAVFLASAIANDRRRGSVILLLSGIFGFISGIIINNLKFIVNALRN